MPWLAKYRHIAFSKPWRCTDKKLIWVCALKILKANNSIFVMIHLLKVSTFSNPHPFNLENDIAAAFSAPSILQTSAPENLQQHLQHHRQRPRLYLQTRPLNSLRCEKRCPPPAAALAAAAALS
mmetsp:Transcript_61895/g.116511  ORF Transcript_61895/g.116511 Transcript_61895/m.116511 type:complete len:124 (-) Transcript_61895:70-441(-)